MYHFCLRSLLPQSFRKDTSIFSIFAKIWGRPYFNGKTHFLCFSLFAWDPSLYLSSAMVYASTFEAVWGRCVLPLKTDLKEMRNLRQFEAGRQFEAAESQLRDGWDREDPCTMMHHDGGYHEKANFFEKSMFFFSLNFSVYFQYPFSKSQLFSSFFQYIFEKVAFWNYPPFWGWTDGTPTVKYPH